MAIQLKSITLLQTSLKLSVPFTTSFGTETELKRTFVLLQTSDGIKGLSEIPTLNLPVYKAESDFYSSLTSLEKFIIPTIADYQKKQGAIDTVDKLRQSYTWIKGANFAKAAVETAFWHILSQKTGKPLNQLFGGTKNTAISGVSIGANSLPEVLRRADMAVSRGFPRLKVKIWPSFDQAPVKALRKKYPKILLQVDANSAYTLQNWTLLKKLENCNLLLIEQPLADDDVIDHAEISVKLKTPICLDESIHSDEDARRAIKLWSDKKILKKLIINIKPPRVGGLVEAIKIAKRCGKAGVPTWCGGMLDTGWGKYINLCFSTRKEVTLPGDHFSPTGATFKQDILVKPLESANGTYTHNQVPSINWKSLKQLTRTQKTYPL